jgi:hypothetical protein
MRLKKFKENFNKKWKLNRGFFYRGKSNKIVIGNAFKTRKLGFIKTFTFSRVQSVCFYIFFLISCRILSNFAKETIFFRATVDFLLNFFYIKKNKMAELGTQILNKKSTVAPKNMVPLAKLLRI